MKMAGSKKTTRKPDKSVSRVLALASDPMHECLMAESMFETGLGSLWISRKLANGKISVGVFLLDVFCLGVKNAMLWENIPLQQYKMMQMMNLGETLVPIEPCCLKKLVQEAEAYAKSLGFKPHKDYETARVILEGIETENCKVQFTFGHKGRPFFIPGLEETPAKIKRIVEQLRKSCGEDGYDVMTEEDMADEEEEYTVTIDDPDKTERLIDGLERLLPCKAAFEEKGWQHLMNEGKVPRGANPSVTIEKLAYSGDFGGILCHLAEHSLVCSLTHLRFPPSCSLYRDITAYQKHRVKKLKKQAA